MTNNAGPQGNNASLAEEESGFDALPEVVRHALANAPYKYGPMRMFHDMVKRRGAEWVAQEIDRVAIQQVAAEALKLYGPDHPQAGR